MGQECLDFSGKRLNNVKEVSTFILQIGLTDGMSVAIVALQFRTIIESGLPI
jgi:hypothetical protein